MANANRMKITVLCYGETEPQTFDEVSLLEFYKDKAGNNRVGITIGEGFGRNPIPFYVDDLLKVEAM